MTTTNSRNREELTHRFARVTANDDGSRGIGRGMRLDAPMFEGLKEAVSLARQMKCDIAHEVYNNALRRWDYLGTCHPDGTCTAWSGERRRFTGDPVRPWARIEEGGAR